MAPAWKTISKATDELNAGDVVYVGARKYSDEIEVNNGGTYNNPIQFIADTDGSKTDDAGNVIVFKSGKTIFEIDAKDYYPDRRIKIKNRKYGAEWEDATGGLLPNCKIFGNSDEGIKIEDASVSVKGARSTAITKRESRSKVIRR